MSSTLVLRNGLELRLGDSRDLPVKLEVARRVIPQLAGAGGYLDVSVPDRPGRRREPQLSG